ncbi:NADH-quinone oxidoreductase subunit C [Streptomyces albiaxialis]|uniref:NADH-quinone oxidoreductase subunit C n=1 Tax=Streptomyces albiaxialis TaxID=329523 RepID=A0ABN2VXX8_9ACTN
MTEPTEPTEPAEPAPQPASESVPEPAPEPASESAEPTGPGTVGWLPGGTEALFGVGATAEDAYGLLTVDVPAESWLSALRVARDALDCTYFDWLSAVDEPGTGFHVCAHVAALPGGGAGERAGEPLRRLVVRTTVPHGAPSLPTATGIYAGASWHERETHEMFGVDFPDHPDLAPLLLPEGFEGHPLRKDFVLAARVAKTWPGAKEPGESGHGGPKRRTMLPPGVPDPNEWGPLKGQLPPAPSRPARGRAAAASGERPARRTRTAGDGSTSQRPPRRARSATEGSASQRPDAPTTEPATPPQAPEAPQASETPEAPQASETPEAPQASETPESAPSPESATPTAPPRSPRSPRRAEEPKSPDQPDSAEPRSGEATAPRSTDAPWHHARPAFEEQGAEESDDEGGTGNARGEEG